MKTAKNSDEAWDLQHRFEDPSGWVQWKGTNVCMDIHCVCGKLSHLDADFAYKVQCPECKRVYATNGHIELIQIEEYDPDYIHTAEP